MTKKSAVLLLTIASVACGKNSPTAPTTTTPPTTTAPPVQTRVIAVTGSLTFGQVFVGAERELTMTITNSGTATLTVRGLSVTGGLADHLFASWSSGTIAAGASQAVVVRFAPRAGGTFSGTVIVEADHTSGTNTLAISATALFNAAGTWTGSYIVDRCEGTGSVQDLLCSTQRGVFPPGSVLPIRITLTQNGSSLSGTVSFGQVTGPVSGVISADGVLTLQGTATATVLSATISTWSTRVSGNGMTGNVTYNVTMSTAPGVGVLGARLSNVTR